ncbi:hypothetical protein ACLB1M_12625 [Escherichia coli]
MIEAAQRSPVYKMAMDWKRRYRCTLNIAPCRWSGTSPLSPIPVLMQTRVVCRKARRAARH